MFDLQHYCDITMCFLWLATYVRGVIGTLKHKKLVISPFATVLGFGMEAGISMRILISGGASIMSPSSIRFGHALKLL